MIRLNFWHDKLSDTELKVTRYVNDNLLMIIRCFIDLLSDNDFDTHYLLPVQNLKVTNEEWRELVNNLYYMVQSDTIRDRIKPKYSYLLYLILEWWEACSDNEDELIPVELDEELVQEVSEEFKTDEDASCVLDAITNYREYYNFLFEDHDFLPELLEKLIIIYLRSPKLFHALFTDVDLEEYRDLMPGDLQEQFDETKIQVSKGEDKGIEQIVCEDVIYCCERLQADYTLRDALEDVINDRLRNLLDAKNYIAKDQTRQGV